MLRSRAIIIIQLVLVGMRSGHAGCSPTVAMRCAAECFDFEARYAHRYSRALKSKMSNHAGQNDLGSAESSPIVRKLTYSPSNEPIIGASLQFIWGISDKNYLNGSMGRR